jgi:carbon-monoxide dehydrogenase medium subunit
VKPAAFDYARPSTLEGALALLADPALDTRILAGGQSLVPMMNFRLARPERLIDINRLAELAYIREEGGTVRIGALARHADVMASPLVQAANPLIAQAYEWVAHHTIRARGTLCGNLCHADPASEMPAVMLAIGATMVARSAGGQRNIAADDFFTGIYATALQPGEMLVEVQVPMRRPDETHGFAETNMRKGDFALCCVAATARMERGIIAGARVAIAGVGGTAFRLAEVEAAMTGAEAATVDLARLGAMAAAHPDITGDQRTPTDYKRDLAAANVARAIGQALGRMPRQHA